MTKKTEPQMKKRKITLPPIGQNVLIQCEGYRGMANRDSEGQWWSAFERHKLSKIIDFIALN
jgi:hypothetical protein